MKTGARRALGSACGKREHFADPRIFFQSLEISLASSAETMPTNEPSTPSLGLPADPPSVGGRSLRNEEVQIATHHDRGVNGDLGLGLHFLSEKPDNRLKCNRSLFPRPLVNRSGNGARPDMRKHRG